MNEEDTLSTQIGVAGEKYAPAICGGQKLVKRNEGEVTLKVLVELMCKVWQITRKNIKAGRDNGKTTVGLVQPGDFVGNCYNCVKRGHKRFECPFKRKAIVRRQEYELCGNTGHNTGDCWGDPKIKQKRCKKWISRKKRKTSKATRLCVDIIL